MKNLLAVSNGKFWVRRAAALLALALLLVGLSGCGLVAKAETVLTHNLAEPLNGATAAKFDIYAGSGNLTIDSLTGGEPLLAGGTLDYVESLGEPARTLEAFNGQANFSLKWGENSAPCTAAIEWLIHLNPAVPSDIKAGSGGGNVKLDLSAMSLTRLEAETGGGNMDVVLPDSMASLSVTAKSGAGNVVVTIPSGTAALIHAKTGIGAVIIDPQFSKVDGETYQSSGYASAANKVEITLSSGAGNVEVKTK